MFVGVSVGVDCDSLLGGLEISVVEWWSSGAVDGGCGGVSLRPLASQ